MDFLENAIKWRPISKTLRFDKNLIPWEAAEGDDTPETLRCVWPFFRFSRVIGMCPLMRQDNRIIVASKWHPSWFFTWFAFTLLSVMWVNFGIKSFPVKGTTEIVVTVNTLIYYTQILTNCVYMILRGKEIPHFVASCVAAEVMVRKCQKIDGRTTTGLMRDTYLLFVFYTAAQFFGNCLYYTSVAKTYNLTNVWDFFTSYNQEFVFGRGNEYSGVFFLFSQFYCDMGWSFADMLLSIFALMLARLFSRFNKVLAKEKSPSLFRAEQLRSYHRQICELVFICSDIFSPLFFVTYVANVAYLFTRLYTGIGNDLKNGHIMAQLEALYAFVFLIFTKILFPSYLGAKLNEKAHEGLDLIHCWPSTVGHPEYKYKLLVLGRFVSQMSTGEVGFSACGYFTLTKSFLVTLISALMTYEVIVLQFQAAALKSKG